MLFLTILSLLVMLAVNMAHASTSTLRRITLLGQICNEDASASCLAASDSFIHKKNLVLENIQHFVRTGYLSKARRLAYECLALLHDKEHNMSSPSCIAASGCSIQHFSSLAGCCPSADEIIQAYKSSTDAFFNDNADFLIIIENALVREKAIQSGTLTSSESTSRECWDGRVSFRDTPMDIDSYSLVGTAPGLKESDPLATGVSHGAMVIERWNNCCSFSD